MASSGTYRDFEKENNANIAALIEACNDSNIVLFCGAGVSIHEDQKNGVSFYGILEKILTQKSLSQYHDEDPKRRDRLDALRHRIFDKKELSSPDGFAELLDIASDCFPSREERSQKRKDIKIHTLKFIRALLNQHNSVETLPNKIIDLHKVKNANILMTANWDLQLCPRISNYMPYNILENKNLPKNFSSTTIHLHGVFDQEVIDPDLFILESEDYKNKNYQSIIGNVFKTLLPNYTFVFIGYSIGDKLIKDIIETHLRESNRTMFYIDYEYRKEELDRINNFHGNGTKKMKYVCPADRKDLVSVLERITTKSISRETSNDMNVGA